MTDLLLVLTGSLLGSAHCIGMCGGLAAALGGAGAPLRPTLARQLVYSLGRIFTYSFLGAIGGFAGLYLSRFQSSLISAQHLFSALAGVIMVLVGLSLLGLRPFGTRRGGAAGGLVAPIFRHFLHARGRFGFFLAGLATGFLPCGLVYGFLAKAVATGSVIGGMAVMGAFGLGTVPAMVAIGCGAGVLSHSRRLKVLRLAACFIIVMGGVTIYRAIPKPDGSCCASHLVSLPPSPAVGWLTASPRGRREQRPSISGEHGLRLCTLATVAKL